MSMNQPQAPFGMPVNQKPKKAGKGLLIGCIVGFLVLGFVVGLLFGRSKGIEAVTKKAYPVLKTTANATGSKRNVAHQYIDPQETSFDWELTDLGDLKFGPYDDEEAGTPVEDIIDQYGKALKVTFGKESMDLVWGDLKRNDSNEDSLDYETTRDMKLGFKKVHGAYYLKDLFYSVDSAEEDSNLMKADEYDKLKVGDPKTGKDGVSYKELLNSHTPSQILIRAEQDYETKDIVTKMEIQFPTSDSDSYRLHFVQQADGDYRLASKGDDD